MLFDTISQEASGLDQFYVELTEIVDTALKRRAKGGSKVGESGSGGFDGHVVRLNGAERGGEEVRWVLASEILAEIRAYLFKHSGYTCSGGIAATKGHANLACGWHKPNQQTIFVCSDSGRGRLRVPSVLRALPAGQLYGVGWTTGRLLRCSAQILCYPKEICCAHMLSLALMPFFCLTCCGLC
jgi:nucleotidyltransferase/DNA polymerase involved in DNA repair